MSRADRLYSITRILRDGQLHTAQSLADRLGVSVRTLYRDMDRLTASGVPIEGARGVGYRAASLTTVPPISLTDDELEALNLGLAIAAEVADETLQSATRSLTAKIDAVLSQSAVAEADAWRFADMPFADTIRGVAHMPTVRAAIRARQKLRITYTEPDGRVTSGTIRPLHLEHWARVWTLLAWCEQREDHREFRLDLIESAEALPELFTDEPGKTRHDFNRA